MQILMLNGCGILSQLADMGVFHALISTFLAVLFIQSGLDKAFHYQGNLDWLKGHFSASFLAGTVPALLSVLTFVELSAGMLSAVGALEALFYGTYCFSFGGTLLSGITLIMLFFGQRVAKDYAGAASLVPYFILVIIHLTFLM